MRPRPLLYARQIEARKRRTRLRVTILVLALGLFGLYRYHSKAAQESSSVTASTIGETSEVLASTTQESKYHVGIQAGHWKTDELPVELKNLWWNGGASAQGINEWEVNLDVAQRVAKILLAEDIAVDVLPATIPPGYEADAFLSIHADGNDDDTVSGFKVGSTQWDPEHKAATLAEEIRSSYDAATNLEEDPNITEDMTQYYAFNFNKFEHAISKDTPGVLVELGFVTNYSDRQLMVRHADTLAEAIARGVLAYKDK